MIDGFHRAHADVSGTGMFSIDDGAGFTLMATLNGRRLLKSVLSMVSILAGK